MVYHEIRVINGKKLNYLVHNERYKGRYIKKSKFIGSGSIKKEKISELKEEFEIEVKSGKNYPCLSKEQVIVIENLKQIYWKNIAKLSQIEFEKFEKSFFTELTYNSNAIEGSSLSLQETNLVLNENLAPEGKTLREIHEAKNHAQALEYIKSYRGEISESFILKLHSIILKDISLNFAGRYRENPVRVIGSDFKFPAPDKIPQLIGNLIYWYKKNKAKMHPFEIAIIFSLKLVSIHPFIDGNGRISRLVMNFILNKNKYPWINVYMRQREAYLKTVRKANDEDYKPALAFMIATLKENLKDFGFLS